MKNLKFEKQVRADEYRIDTFNCQRTVLLLVSRLSSLVAGEQKTNPEHETETEKQSLYKGAKLRVWYKNSVQRVADSVQKNGISSCKIRS